MGFAAKPMDRQGIVKHPLPLPTRHSTVRPPAGVSRPDKEKFMIARGETRSATLTNGSTILGGLLAGLLAIGGFAGAAQAQGSGSATLDAVKARGQLVCGVAGDTAGFSLPDSKGVMQGIDAEECRALAAAVLGDSSKVKFSPLTTQNRFTALQSGEVDVLIRETTWTLGRQASLGFLFAPINFYDGTGFLVKKSAGVADTKGLDGATICVQPGTSTELAIADYFRGNNLKFTPIEIENLQQIQQAFLSGRCDAYSTDSSALAGFRFTQGDKASDFVLLPTIISKEPLAPVVRKGDDKWFDIVSWVEYAQMTGEEDGVNAKNIDTFATTTNPDIRRLIGLDGDLGKALGLDNKWAYNVIKQVGNTEDVWNKTIAPLGVPRGINGPWNKGGLEYAPPMR
jgi:general L-amino acid transport system substrate-binding protein